MPNENKWDFEWEFGKKFVVLMEIRIIIKKFLWKLQKSGKKIIKKIQIYLLKNNCLEGNN